MADSLSCASAKAEETTSWSFAQTPSGAATSCAAAAAATATDSVAAAAAAAAAAGLQVTEQYGELVNFIIRPPRDTYTDEDLGPDLFSLAGKAYKRTGKHLELINRRNMRLQCSHYEPVLPAGETRQLPCVIYLHGNCSSRVEALSALPVLLPHNITVFAFDFSGSGRSDGPYISLGWWERDDLDTVVEHLRSTGTVSSIGLWGRSMGAVTALMHAHRDPSIGGMQQQQQRLQLQQQRQQQQHQQLDSLSTQLLPFRGFSAKSLVFDKGLDLMLAVFGVEGGHNSPRPAFMLHSAAIFFRNTLNPLALSLGGRGRRERGSSTSERCIDSASSSTSELCSNASSGDLVIPLHPFADSDFSPAAAAAPNDTKAAAAAAAVAGRQAAAGSPTTTSGSSRRRPWRSSSSSSSSSKKEAEQQQPACEKGESHSAFLRRSSLLSRGLLRWGASRGQCEPAAEAATAAPEAAASTSSSSSSRSRQQQSRHTQAPTAEASAQPAAAASTAAARAAPAAAAAAAAAASAPADPVRSMAPPLPSFCFLNSNEGLEPLAFIEDVGLHLLIFFCLDQ
ncbi:hypothetical protein Emag_000167 [Eimeria magna]